MSPLSESFFDEPLDAPADETPSLERKRARVERLSRVLRGVLETNLPAVLETPDWYLGAFHEGLPSLRRLHHLSSLVCEATGQRGKSVAMVENLGRACDRMVALAEAGTAAERARILAAEKDAFERLVLDFEDGTVAGRFRSDQVSLIEQVARDLKRSTSRLRVLHALVEALRKLPAASWLLRGRREHALGALLVDHAQVLDSFGVYRASQLERPADVESLLQRAQDDATAMRVHVQAVRDEVYREDRGPVTDLEVSGVDLESAKVVALLKDTAAAGLDSLMRIDAAYRQALTDVRGGPAVLERIHTLKREIREIEARDEPSTDEIWRRKPS